MSKFFFRNVIVLANKKVYKESKVLYINSKEWLIVLTELLLGEYTSFMLQAGLC